jgi:CheY-like chemotaxis protein
MLSDASRPQTLIRPGTSALVRVVDDVLGMRQLLRYQMEHQGYRVVEAANGEQSLHAYHDREIQTQPARLPTSLAV